MKTSIIATIGTASDNEKTIEKMALNGADCLRINFSHANREQYLRVKQAVKKIRKKTGKKLIIMQDLQGPRLRIGKLKKPLPITIGEIYYFKRFKAEINNREIPVDNNLIIRQIKKGDKIFLGNGEIVMTTIGKGKDYFKARAENSGLLLSRKGINLPQTSLAKNNPTAQDLKDIKFALEEGVEAIALSFVESAKEIIKVRNFIKKYNKLKTPRLIIKIERAEALKNIEEIILASDGIMIARGDLGIETPLEDLPIIQKHLIARAHWHNKPAIVATEMLLSMTKHPRPTRAEVADIANAIFDGADAVMLSEETAIGVHPDKVVQTMKKIADRTDSHLGWANRFKEIFNLN